MAQPIRDGLLFLVNTLFDLYLIILIVRLILVYVGANYFDPFTQFIVRLTDFLVKPLRKVIKNVNRIEIATLLLIFVLSLIKFLLVLLIYGHTPNPVGLFILAFADFLRLIINVFFYAILLQAILSWVQPYSPINRTLYQFTYPIMAPFRRLIPPIAAIDVSPVLVLIMLQLLLILLISPLTSLGFALAFGQ